MFQWLFGNKSSGSKVVAILDVGSGSVGGALGVLNREGLPELLFTAREELPLRMTRESTEMAKNAAEASKRVLDQVRKAAALWNDKNRIVPKRIDHLAVFLATPWSTGTLRTLRLKRAQPFAMSSAVLRKMLAEETRMAMAHQDSGLEILERVATGLRLNGYLVDTVSDALVHEAEVTLATSLAPKAFLALLVDALGDMPSHTKKSFHSFGLPVAHVLPRIVPNCSDALVLDAGAEVTEIIRLKDSVPWNKATSPAGSHMLLRTLKAHGRMARKEAETTLKLAHLEGTRLSETHKTAISGAARTWAKEVLLAAASLTQEGSPPMQAFVFSDAPPQQWLIDALASEPYPKQTTGIQLVRGITAKDFDSQVRLRGTPADPFLCAELLFLDERFDDRQMLELLSPRDPLLTHLHSKGAGAILKQTVPQESAVQLSVK